MHKNSIKFIFNIRAKQIKLLEDNIEKYLLDFGLGKNLLDMTLKKFNLCGRMTSGPSRMAIHVLVPRTHKYAQVYDKR